MTLFDVEELTQYWVEHPPLHILAGAYLGVAKQQHHSASRDGSRNTARSDLEESLAELGPGFHAGDVHAGLTPAVLDFDELRRQTATR
jgi:hypothetical protein